MPQTDTSHVGTHVSNPVLPTLLELMSIETGKGRGVIPLAALCKRMGLRMSTMQRHLTALENYELVGIRCDESGRWTTWLTANGLELCDAMRLDTVT